MGLLEKIREAKTLGRHPLPRHADDTFTVATIKRINPNIQVTETRDDKILKDFDVLIDVGGVYDPETLRFDHHQADCVSRPDGMPYSSFGLIWKHLGTDICGDASIASYVDETFVRTIDAIDNGIAVHQKVEGFRTIDIASVIGLFNPTWAEDDNQQIADLQLALAGAILDRVIIKAQHKRMAEEEVKAAIAEENGGIIILNRFLPWQDYVSELSQTAKVVLFPARDGGWNCQAVPAELGNRAAGNRTNLPTFEDASDRLGADLKFIHKGRFIGGAWSFCGALTLAQMSVGSVEK